MVDNGPDLIAPAAASVGESAPTQLRGTSDHPSEGEQGTNEDELRKRRIAHREAQRKYKQRVKALARTQTAACTKLEEAIRALVRQNEALADEGTAMCQMIDYASGILEIPLASNRAVRGSSQLLMDSALQVVCTAEDKMWAKGVRLPEEAMR